MKQRSKMRCQKLLVFSRPGALVAILTTLVAGSAFGQATNTGAVAAQATTTGSGSGATVEVLKQTVDQVEALFRIPWEINGQSFVVEAWVGAQGDASHPAANTSTLMVWGLFTPQGDTVAVFQAFPVDAPCVLTMNEGKPRLAGDLRVYPYVWPDGLPPLPDSVHVDIEWDATGKPTRGNNNSVDHVRGGYLSVFHERWESSATTASGAIYSPDGFNFVTLDTMANAPVGTTEDALVSSTTLRQQWVQTPDVNRR